MSGAAGSMKSGTKVMPTTPPAPPRARSCSSVRLRGWSHRARQQLWLATTGAVEKSRTSQKPRSFRWETSRSMPSSFIRRTTSRPKPVSPPPPSHLAAVGGVGAGAVGQGHGAHADLVESVQGVQTVLQGGRVLHGEDHGEPPGGAGVLDVGGREGDGGLAGVALHLPLQVAEGIEGVEEVVVPGDRRVHGEVPGVDPAFPDAGQGELKGPFGGVELLAHVGDGADPPPPLGAALPGQPEVAAPDQAHGGVVVGVDDEGVAVQVRAHGISRDGRECRR